MSETMTTGSGEPVHLEGGPAPRLTPLSRVRFEARVYSLIGLVIIPVLFIPMSVAVQLVILCAWLVGLFGAWWMRSLRFAHPVLELRWDQAEGRAGRRDRAAVYAFTRAWELAGGDPNPRHDEIAAALAVGTRPRAAEAEPDPRAR